MTTPEEDFDLTPTDRPSGAPMAGDRELMRHFDGELEPRVAREVERRLASDATARDKRAGLILTGDIVREVVDGDRRADGIAEGVMARLFADGDGMPGLDDPLEGLPDELPAAELAPASPAMQRDRGSIAEQPAANDNARVIFALAAAAAAVAAGMFLWGQTEPADTIAFAPPSEIPAEVEITEPHEATGPREGAPAPSAAVEAEEAPAPVEVAAVDFGAQSGSVFYVSGHNSATAVVWVTGVGEEP